MKSSFEICVYCDQINQERNELIGWKQNFNKQLK